MDEKICVLIIDDSVALLTRLRERLSVEGYEVVTTTQTVGAARHLLKCDLALIDYHMPGIDGGAVLSSLRGACRDRQPLFFLFTSDAKVAPTYRALGFDGVITNKGDDDSLVKQLAAALRMVKLKSLSKKRDPGPA
jgi:two-component system, OmpR family, response regulator